MRNAKVELLECLERCEAQIKCASIMYGDPDFGNSQYFILRLGASDPETDAFFESLDFEYDSGYGRQHLFGTVWLEKEGTWMERGEYDGSEWWDYHECPEIPMEMF